VTFVVVVIVSACVPGPQPEEFLRVLGGTRFLDDLLIREGADELRVGRLVAVADVLQLPEHAPSQARELFLAALDAVRRTG
jgi:hypothetical protein